tara:strand:+ start:151 stop:531 length:381 start_codon:yes stop_codon:yes gene_type:complete
MLLSLLFSCGEKEIPITEGYTDGQSYYVVYETDPSPIPFNEEFSVLVSVYESDQKMNSITDVTVEVDATMPAHEHGMNQSPTMSGPTDGLFSAEGLLWHMEGEWELSIYVSGESNESIAFATSCCQ